ncbi:MAG: hypothetical protein ABFS23_00230 [Pseudomonadota bacterium]
MKNIQTKNIFLVFLVLCPLAPSASLFGSEANQRGCLREDTREAAGNVVADTARKPCAALVDLPGSVLADIELVGRITTNGFFEGKIINRTTDWNITDITVRVRDDATGGFSDYEPVFWEGRYIPVDSISPNSKAIIIFQVVEPPKTPSWFITKGRGYK